MSQESDINLAKLQSDIFVHVILQIEPMSNFLLYAKFIVALLVLLLTHVQLFNDVLLFIHVIVTLMSLMATTVTTDLM